jgi:glutaredoxin
MAKITMYSTAICPYCVAAERLLRSKGVGEIDKIRVDLDPAQRAAMMEKTGRRTVPQSISTKPTSAASTICPPSSMPASSTRC